MAITNVYGNGTTTATAGANTITHFYDRAGIKAANRVEVYGQFADRKSMPLNMGKTFKISKFLHMYDRNLATDGDFAAKGFMTARSADAVSAALASAGLSEGAGAQNKRSLQKVTFDTSFARYGEMMDFTDEVDMFSEDFIQVKYREELGELANVRYEDLIQMDLLSTTTKMYAGAASSMATLGTGVDALGAADASWKVSYDLIRAASRKLVRNRAKKTSSMVTGSTKIDTKTVAKAFYAVIGADVKADLENLTRGTGYEKEYVFTPVHKYADAGTYVQGEVGSMHETIFVEAEQAVVYYGKGAEVTAGYTGSLSATTFADNAAAVAARGLGAVAGTYFDVFPILYPTQGAFATVGLKGNDKIKFNSKSPEQVELINPYGTQGFFSYNFWYAGIILEEEKLLRVDVLASK
jgi:N4-gp56 family major capsid protein